jgi:hypothetical protein
MHALFPSSAVLSISNMEMSGQEGEGKEEREGERGRRRGRGRGTRERKRREGEGGVNRKREEEIHAIRLIGRTTQELTQVWREHRGVEGGEGARGEERRVGRWQHTWNILYCICLC